MAVEVVGSIGIGLLSSSLALIAFGSDSLVELFSALAVSLHLRSDSSGSDVLGGGTAKLTRWLLISLIPIIGGGAAYSYFTGVEPEASLLGIALAAGAVMIMPILWTQKRRIGRETNCEPLSTDALASATCFLMSVALLGGLLVNYFLSIRWVDYVAAAIILAFVAREARETFSGRVIPN